MKIKNDADLWNVIEESIQQKIRWSYSNLSLHPINRLLELEDADFLKAIEFCKKYKKTSLQQDYEAYYSEWKNGDIDNLDDKVLPSNFLNSFIARISYAKQYKKQDEIRAEVSEAFKEHTEMLDNIHELNVFLMEFKDIEREYFRLEKKWEKNCAVMEKLNALKTQGITAQDFRWNLVEEADEDDA